MQGFWNLKQRMFWQQVNQKFSAEIVIKEDYQSEKWNIKSNHRNSMSAEMR